jgi:hypothetical protein
MVLITAREPSNPGDGYCLFKSGLRRDLTKVCRIQAAGAGSARLMASNAEGLIGHGQVRFAIF